MKINYGIFIVALVPVIAYLIGSINSSILISRIVMGKDIREVGSGNAGATNMLRTMGKKYAVITLITDILKGVVAVGISYLLVRSSVMPYIAGVCVVLGHNFPIFFGFKGGKGVATSLGVVMMLDWKTGLIVLAAAVAVIAITRYVSLGSIVAAIAFAALEIIKLTHAGSLNTVQIVCVLILSGLIVVRHNENIGRLLSGTESKLGEKKE